MNIINLGDVSPSQRRLKMLSYDDAKNDIQKLEFKNRGDFFKFYKGTKGLNIPGRPDLFYSKQWEDWGTFLGNGNLSKRDKEFLGIDEVRKIILDNNIGNRREWISFHKDNSYKYNIPFNLESTYGKKYSYFFGNIPHKKMKSFHLSIDIVKYLCEYYRVKTQKDWNKLTNIYRRLPKSPKYYDINLNEKVIISYDESKIFLKKLKIDSIYKWNKLINNKPSFIPRHPDYYYEDWVSWRDVLSYERTNVSIGEIEVEKCLIKNNIIYERYKKFDGCFNVRRLEFYFYISDIRTVIEFDGGSTF